MIEVLDPGMLTTVQDAGRAEWTHLGVPVGGACDRWSLAVSNLLAGNDPDAACLEMTVVGPTLLARADMVVGVAGGSPGGGTFALHAGETLDLRGIVEDPRRTRAYLAVPGGFDVPVVLGSASTAIAPRFGGLEGRALRAGDVLTARGRHRDVDAGAVAWPVTGGEPEPGGVEPPIRLIPGPAAGDGWLDALLAGPWTVGTGSDRVGIRLDGPPIAGAPASAGGLLSHGVTFGAVQLPPDGTPIVLLADGQTTGGYPVAAVVISADRPRIGQLRPGAPVAFESVALGAARAALAHRQASLDRGAAILRETAGWDELWHAAGG